MSNKFVIDPIFTPLVPLAQADREAITALIEREFRCCILGPDAPPPTQRRAVMSPESARLLATFARVCAETAPHALRRQIDDVLAEDARRWPAFAVARKAAVLADIEDSTRPDDYSADDVRELLDELHAWEDERGIATRPVIPDMWREDDGGEPLSCILVYERARGMR